MKNLESLFTDCIVDDSKLLFVKGGCTCQCGENKTTSANVECDTDSTAGGDSDICPPKKEN